MELASGTETKRDKQGTKNGQDFDILRKDEAFWQKTVKILAKNQISNEKVECEIENGSDENKVPARHPEKVFCVYCKCSKCLIYRQTILGIYVENSAYNQLWAKLQEIICSYYTLLPADQDSVINRKYQELLTESCGIRWFSDGSIDVKKNIHVSMGSYFSLSNEMTFIIVFNMLYTRDRHQLFELLCLQLTSIILAYREGIKEMTKCVDGDGEYYKPEEFLNYILNGYDRITEIAETLTPLVIEMRDHLQKFSLTWQLMNQCMYYRFLYVDIESRMADCILRLKDAVDAETYKSFVYRFIKFDEEMTSIGQVWEVALVALEIYRKSTPEQVARVDRITTIRQILQSVRDLKDIPSNVDNPLNDQALALDWIVSGEKDDVWLSVINSIKNEPHRKDVRKRPCKCWACLMADKNAIPEICIIPNSNSAITDVKKKKSSDDSYHLAWGVFKHLKDRQPYTKQIINPEVFCVFNEPPCQRMECQVATNLIIGNYPMSFSKFLLRTYQPLSANDREKFLKVPSQSLIRKFCLKKGGAAAKEIMQEADEINHSFLLLNMFWDDDDIADPMLRAGLAAALAENFKIDTKFPQKHIIFSYFYALFRTDQASNDIVLDLEWLEKVNMENLFKSFGVISKSIHDSSAMNANSVEAIEMTLNELKITAEVSAGGNVSDTLDLVQFSMKEVAEKLSSISLTDDNESAKAVIENEIKKPLVEALKLAASNKKLEAELKSLQKEHNMLKDMVKGLEQIHGEKKEVSVTVTTATKTAAPDGHTHSSKCGHSHTQSSSSSPTTSDADHGKDSGNGADCVCYYCTLFGKNQDLVANSRSTETRDRLRKRLHHLQSQKDFSATKKEAPGKQKNSLKNISLMLKNGVAAATTSTAAVTATAGATKCQQEGPVHKCTPNGNSPSASMKMKVELELQQHKKKKPNAVTKPNYTNKPEEVKIQRATEINLKSLDNLLEYIEGPSSKAVIEQRKAEEVAAKKQQKKVKQQQQKIRRQIDQKLDALKDLNGELQTIIVELKQIQNQLGQLKAGKGKNKELKKVKVAEERLMELNDKLLEKEDDVRMELDSIKDLNPNIDLAQECGELKHVLQLMGMVQQPIAKVTSIPLGAYQKMQIQQQPPTIMIPSKSIETSSDPAKRMVTIRRINLPHAEPQVTVTAKGTTPDMDQLLYTFVNGQLVPASSLSPSAFQNVNGSIQLFMSSNGQTKMVVENQIEQQHLQQQKNVKNKKVAQVPVHSAVAATKKKQQAVVPEKVLDKPKETKKELKKAKKEQQSTQTNKRIQELSKKDKREKSTDSKKQETATKMTKPESDIKKKKKDKKAFIDPEFAANPFKLLDDDEMPAESEDDSSIASDTSSEINVEISKPTKDSKSTKNKTTAHAAQTPQQVNNMKQPQKKQQQTLNQKVKNVERQDSVTSVTSSNASKDSKQSKKQKKPLLEQKPLIQPMSMQAQQFNPTIYKPVDFVKKPAISSPQPQLNSNSIMDQLNRGVRVEGLRLPPGITLTKVTPSAADPTKRESINRITQPMQDCSTTSRLPSDEHMVFSQSRDPNGIIMVESNPLASKCANASQSTSADAGGKKKNKKKKSKSDATASADSVKQSQQPLPVGNERMVTLKNPMFYSNSEPMNAMMRNLQTPPFISPMEPQGASIIKNDNGMYTIRNPSFQSAMGMNNSTSASPPFISRPPNVERPYAPPVASSFSYSGSQSVDESEPKCSSVIGSEMKNALQRRKEQEYAANMEGYQYGAVTPGMRPQSTGYSHFGGTGMNFNANGTNCDAGGGYMSQANANTDWKYSSSLMSNYDDLRLQPGQMLNSEVSIHNSTESKFFQSHTKRTPPPIGTPRNGIPPEGPTNLFSDLMAGRSMAPGSEIKSSENSIFMSNQNKSLNDIETDEREETFKRFDFNYVPPMTKMKSTNDMHNTRMSNAIVDDCKKPNSTNSNSSPSSMMSELDELYENGSQQKTQYYAQHHHNFNDSKPSSLFSSGSSGM